MKLSRREWVRVGATAAGAAVLDAVGAPTGTPPASASTPPAAARWLTRDAFQGQMRGLFAVQGPRVQARLFVSAVEDVPCAKRAGVCGDPNSFTVLFRGAVSSPLTQGTYRVTNAALGGFDLFLVPGGGDGAGLTYVATFNRATA